MKNETRQLVSFTFITAGACAAFSLFVLSPIQNQNKAAAANLASAQAAAKQLGELQPMGPLWEKQLADAATTTEWYKAKNALAANPASLHSQISRFARARSIDISRIDPQTASSPIKTADITSFGIMATGSLDHLTMFIDDLTTQCGFTRIDTINFSPLQTPEGPQIRASIQTSHFSFSIAEQQLAQAETAP